jgi:phosphotransferase system enzyme I (PtsI)
MATDRDLPAVTRDGVEVAIRANIELPREIEMALRYGAQGIGLYRSEFLFLGHSPRLPTEEDHYRTYLDVAGRVAPHPAIVRTLDLGGEKYFHEVLGRPGGNPVLGLRGIRLCLARPDIFVPQLRGLLRAAAERPNLKAMLPLVTNPDEIRQVRGMLAAQTQQLAAAGLAARGDLELGIMIEVPAAALAADVLAREADFFSIGTNDLIQYALAVDRGDESVAHLYQPLHAGVLRMVRMAIDSAAKHGRPVAMCGEMAADVESVGLLVGLGLRELSVQPRAIAAVRRAVRATHAAGALRQAEELLEGQPSGFEENRGRR